MSERLTTKQIENLRVWHAMDSEYRLSKVGAQQVVTTLLHLHDIIQRLQTLQPADITAEELEAVNEELPGVFVWTKIIAAACRGITRKAGGDG